MAMGRSKPRQRKRNQLPVISEGGHHDIRSRQGNHLPVHDLHGDRAFHPGQYTELRIVKAPVHAMESLSHYSRNEDSNHPYLAGNSDVEVSGHHKWPPRAEDYGSVGCCAISSPLAMASTAARFLPGQVFHSDREILPSCLYPKPVKIKLNVKPVEPPPELMEATDFVSRSRNVRVSLFSSSDSAEQISLKLLHDLEPETEPEPENIHMPSELMPPPPPPEELVEVNLLPVGDSQVAHLKEHFLRFLGFGACVCHQFAVCVRWGCKAFRHKSAPIAGHAKRITLERCVPGMRQACIACFSFGEDSDSEMDLEVDTRPLQPDRPSHYDNDVAWKMSLRDYSHPEEDSELQPDDPKLHHFGRGEPTDSMGDNPQDGPTPELSIFEGYPHYTQPRDSFEEDKRARNFDTMRSVVPFKAADNTSDSAGYHNRALKRWRTRLARSVRTQWRGHQGLGALVWRPPDIRNFTDPLRRHLLVERLAVRPEPRYYRDLIQKPPLGDEVLWRSTLRAYLTRKSADVRPEDALVDRKPTPMRNTPREESEKREEDHAKSDKNARFLGSPTLHTTRHGDLNRKGHHYATKNRPLQKFLPNWNKDIKHLGNSRVPHDLNCRDPKCGKCIALKSHAFEKLMRKEDSSHPVSSMNSRMEDGGFRQSPHTVHSSKVRVPVSQPHGKKRPHSPQPSTEEVPHVEKNGNSTPAHHAGKHQKLEVLSAPDSLMKAKFSERPLKIRTHKLSDSDPAEVGSPAESGQRGTSLKSPRQSPQLFFRQVGDEISPSLTRHLKEKPRVPSRATSPPTPFRHYKEANYNLHLHGHRLPPTRRSPPDLPLRVSRTPSTAPRKRDRKQGSALGSHESDLDSQGKSGFSLVRDGLSFLWRSRFSMFTKHRQTVSRSRPHSPGTAPRRGRNRVRDLSDHGSRSSRGKQRDHSLPCFPSKDPRNSAKNRCPILGNVPRVKIFVSKKDGPQGLRVLSHRPGSPLQKGATVPAKSVEGKEKTAKSKSMKIDCNLKTRKKDDTQLCPRASTSFSCPDYTREVAKRKQIMNGNLTGLSRSPKKAAPSQTPSSARKARNWPHTNGAGAQYSRRSRGARSDQLQINSSSPSKYRKITKSEHENPRKSHVHRLGDDKPNLDSLTTSHFFTPEKTYFRKSFELGGDENKSSDSPDLKVEAHISKTDLEPESKPKIEDGADFSGRAKTPVPVPDFTLSRVHDRIEHIDVSNIPDVTSASTTKQASKSAVPQSIPGISIDTGNDDGDLSSSDVIQYDTTSVGIAQYPNIVVPGNEDGDTSSSDVVQSDIIQFQRNPEISKLLTAYKEALIKEVESPNGGTLETESFQQSRMMVAPKSNAIQFESSNEHSELTKLEYLEKTVVSFDLTNAEQKLDAHHTEESKSSSENHHDPQLVYQSSEELGQELYAPPDAHRNVFNAIGLLIKDGGSSEFQAQRELTIENKPLKFQSEQELIYEKKSFELDQSQQEQASSHMGKLIQGANTPSASHHHEEGAGTLATEYEKKSFELDQSQQEQASSHMRKFIQGANIPSASHHHEEGGGTLATEALQLLSDEIPRESGSSSKTRVFDVEIVTVEELVIFNDNEGQEEDNHVRSKDDVQITELFKGEPSDEDRFSSSSTSQSHHGDYHASPPSEEHNELLTSRQQHHDRVSKDDHDHRQGGTVDDSLLYEKGASEEVAGTLTLAAEALQLMSHDIPRDSGSSSKTRVFDVEIVTVEESVIFNDNEGQEEDDHVRSKDDVQIIDLFKGEPSDEDRFSSSSASQSHHGDYHSSPPSEEHNKLLTSRQHHHDRVSKDDHDHRQGGTVDESFLYEKGASEEVAGTLTLAAEALQLMSHEIPHESGSSSKKRVFDVEIVTVEESVIFNDEGQEDDHVRSKDDVQITELFKGEPSDEDRFSSASASQSHHGDNHAKLSPPSEEHNKLLTSRQQHHDRVSKDDHDHHQGGTVDESLLYEKGASEEVAGTLTLAAEALQLMSHEIPHESGSSSKKRVFDVEIVTVEESVIFNDEGQEDDHVRSKDDVQITEFFKGEPSDVDRFSSSSASQSHHGDYHAKLSPSAEEHNKLLTSRQQHHDRVSKDDHDHHQGGTVDESLLYEKGASEEVAGTLTLAAEANQRMSHEIPRESGSSSKTRVFDVEIVTVEESVIFNDNEGQEEGDNVRSKDDVQITELFKAEPSDEDRFFSSSASQSHHGDYHARLSPPSEEHNKLLTSRQQHHDRVSKDDHDHHQGGTVDESFLYEKGASEEVTGTLTLAPEALQLMSHEIPHESGSSSKTRVFDVEIVTVEESVIFNDNEGQEEGDHVRSKDDVQITELFKAEPSDEDRFFSSSASQSHRGDYHASPPSEEHNELLTSRQQHHDTVSKDDHDHRQGGTVDEFFVYEKGALLSELKHFQKRAVQPPDPHHMEEVDHQVSSMISSHEDKSGSQRDPPSVSSKLFLEEHEDSHGDRLFHLKEGTKPNSNLEHGLNGSDHSESLGELEYKSLVLHHAMKSPGFKQNDHLIAHDEEKIVHEYRHNYELEVPSFITGAVSEDGEKLPSSGPQALTVDSNTQFTKTIIVDKNFRQLKLSKKLAAWETVARSNEPLPKAQGRAFDDINTVMKIISEQDQLSHSESLQFRGLDLAPSIKQKTSKQRGYLKDDDNQLGSARSAHSNLVSSEIPPSSADRHAFQFLAEAKKDFEDTNSFDAVSSVLEPYYIEGDHDQIDHTKDGLPTNASNNQSLKLQIEEIVINEEHVNRLDKESVPRVEEKFQGKNQPNFKDDDSRAGSTSSRSADSNEGNYATAYFDHTENNSSNNQSLELQIEETIAFVDDVNRLDKESITRVEEKFQGADQLYFKDDDNQTGSASSRSARPSEENSEISRSDDLRLITNVEKDVEDIDKELYHHNTESIEHQITVEEADNGAIKAHKGGVSGLDEFDVLNARARLDLTEGGLPSDNYSSLNQSRNVQIEKIITSEKHVNRFENESPTSRANLEDLESQANDPRYLEDGNNQLGSPSSRPADSSEANSEILPSDKRYAFNLITSAVRDLEDRHAFEVLSNVEKELRGQDTKLQSPITLDDLIDKEGDIDPSEYADLLEILEDDPLESPLHSESYETASERGFGTSSTSDTEGGVRRSRSFDELSSESGRSPSPPPRNLPTTGTEVTVTTTIDEVVIVVESDEDFMLGEEESSFPRTTSQGSSSGTSVLPRSKTRKSVFVRPALKKSLVAGSESERILAQVRSEENLAAQRLNIKSRDETGLRRSRSFDEMPKSGSSRKSLFVRPFLKKSLVGDAETEQTLSRLRSEQLDEVDQPLSDNAESSSTVLQFSAKDKRADSFVPRRSSRNSSFMLPVLKKSLVLDSETGKDFARLKNERNEAEDNRSEGGDKLNAGSVLASPRRSLFVRPVLKKSLVSDSATESLFAQLQSQNEKNSSEQSLGSRERGGLSRSASFEGIAVGGTGSSSSLSKSELRSDDLSSVPFRPRKSLITRPVLKKSLVADAQTLETFTRLQLGQNEVEDTSREQRDPTRPGAAFEGLLFGSRSSPLTSSDGSTDESSVPTRSRASQFVRPFLKKSLVADDGTARLLTQLQSEQTEAENLKARRERRGTSRSASFEGLPTAPSSSSPANSEGSDESSMPVGPARKSLFQRPLLKKSLVVDSEIESTFARLQSEQRKVEDTKIEPSQLDNRGRGSVYRSASFDGLPFGSRNSPPPGSEGTAVATSVPSGTRKQSQFVRPFLKKSLVADSETTNIFAQLQAEENKLVEEPQQSAAAEGPAGPRMRKSSLKRALSISISSDTGQSPVRKRVKFNATPEDADSED